MRIDRQAARRARKFKTPQSWKPVEINRLPHVDLAPHFRDWVTCTHCDKGIIEEREQKDGYVIRKRTQCPKCHGQGGWKKHNETEATQD